jgi:putative copper resistance protein D
MVAVPVDTFTGLALVMQARNPFPSYRSMGPRAPGAVLSNIHLGGGIMWIGGDALMLLALIPIAVSWVKSETVKTRELDKILDAAGI